MSMSWKKCLAGVAGFALSFSLLAQTRVEYIHTDALGSPVAVTDASGNVVEREVYEPYGSPITRPGSDQPGFTGHVADSLTSLTYMQQRYYDPQIGKFLSVDPVTAYSNPVGAFNRYTYANNNPYKFTDPDGRLACLLGRQCSGNDFELDVFRRSAKASEPASGDSDKSASADGDANARVDPYKLAASTLRAMNSGRLAASAFTKLGVVAPVSSTGVGVVPSAGVVASAVWNLRSSATSWQKAGQLYSEGLKSDTSGYTGSQKFRLVVMGGIVPFGTLSDDPWEPPYERAVVDHLKNTWNKSPMNIVDELGEVMP